MDKILPGKICILISVKQNVFTHINSQQMWMNFNTFPDWKTYRLCNCVIRYDRLAWTERFRYFNLDAVDK